MNTELATTNTVDPFAAIAAIGAAEGKSSILRFVKGQWLVGESLGEPYDPMRPLPYSPWPVPGSNPELEAGVDRRVDEAEAAEVDRQRAHPRPEPVEILGPRSDKPGVVIFDSLTRQGLADSARWRAEAEAAGHKVLAPQ